MFLKDTLKRGALVTAANWQVVIIQFVADALFKTLLAVPVAGGALLVVLIVGGSPSALLAMSMADILSTVTAVLLAHPAALAGFLAALAVVVAGGSLLMFLVKGGTVSVLIAAENAAGAIERPPLRRPAFQRAVCFSLERFTAGAERLFGRYVRLGVGLSCVYALSIAAALLVAFGPAGTDDWQGPAAVASAALAAWITLVNFVYLLFQIVIAMDDCTVAEAAPRVLHLLRARAPLVGSILAATLGLVLLATAASILATAALGLIAFVPLVGLAALPLQVIAWLLRGLVFQYIGLTALVAYARAYRGLRDATARPAAPVPFETTARRA